MVKCRAKNPATCRVHGGPNPYINQLPETTLDYSRYTPKSIMRPEDYKTVTPLWAFYYKINNRNFTQTVKDLLERDEQYITHYVPEFVIAKLRTTKTGIKDNQFIDLLKEHKLTLLPFHIIYDNIKVTPEH